MDNRRSSFSVGTDFGFAADTETVAGGSGVLGNEVVAAVVLGIEAGSFSDVVWLVSLLINTTAKTYMALLHCHQRALLPLPGPHQSQR